MSSLTLLVNLFAYFLDVAWEAMQPIIALDKTGSLQIDWMRANWELIVEGGLRPKPIFQRPRATYCLTAWAAQRCMILTARSLCQR